jgi:hypothetical protein
MRSRSSQRSALIFTLSGVLLLAAFPRVLMADSRDDHKPAMAKSGDMDDHMAESIDPSTRLEKSQEMLEGYSEDPDDMVAESGQEHVVETQELENHMGSSTALQDLKSESPDDGFEVIDDGRLAQIVDSNLSARQLVAKRHLERAQKEATMARTRYGDMMRDDYPRGKPRLRIIDQRDESMRALDQARAEFDAAMGN